jgi:membrane-associated protease RseP (regulator of RpoE activity)
MNSSGTVTPFEGGVAASWPRLWWVNAACALSTLLTTTLFGSALVSCFDSGQPLNPDLIWLAYLHVFRGEFAIWSGLEFSIPLLLILLAHEMGHYLQCRHWQVEATLPYFLPSPSLFGTFGAFIRIKSPIFTRTSLFDIGIAGPLAGFAVLIPCLIVGVALSHPVLLDPSAEPLRFGSPLALQLLERAFFPHVPSAQVVLHPLAVAAWVGLLATAINLLPGGQLDGGHIVYALFGPRVHRIVSTGLVVVLAILGFWYWTWWAWAVAQFFFGRRHPLVYDRTPVSAGRVALAGLICLIFVLSFTLVPVRVSP